MQRIIIIGGAGAGKSTLARKLEQITGLPLLEVDLLFRDENNEPRPLPEMTAMVDEASRADRWIIEGSRFGISGSAIAADTCIWIDLPTTLRLWGILRRVLSGRCRKFPGRNRFAQLYNQREFLGKVWRNRHRTRRMTRDLV